MTSSTQTTGFQELGLPEPILQSLRELGYETPSPIQQASIPVVMTGGDLIGQAQTGTGKTAAFALPLLAKLDPTQNEPQVLVMTPTRELAVQVAEAFQRYARHLPKFRIAPIYGGQDFRPQLKLLKQGVHVVVGTPGRLLDHLRRGSLDISRIHSLVLDEADEMLRMGFIEDVEAILSHCSGNQQTALFSATMPQAIRRIADNYLTDPQHIVIKSATATVDRIDQSHWLVDGRRKLEALRRYLETRTFDAVIVFVRTRDSASEVAEKVNAWGYRSEAIHGAINQNQREKVINGLKKNKFDILVATDVAARGLDVDRFSHVVNFDIPYDSESYVHRIGRTGRAGRSGTAILFVTRREHRLLRSIEQDTKQRIPRSDMPDQEAVTEQRISRFKENVATALANPPSELASQLAKDITAELQVTPETITALLIDWLHEDNPLTSNDPEETGKSDEPDIPHEASSLKAHPEVEMERFRLDLGKSHGIGVGDIVGAIINELGIDSELVGEINLRRRYSTVDLPAGMPRELFSQLKKIKIRKKLLGIRRYGKSDSGSGSGSRSGSGSTSKAAAKPANKSSRPAKGKPGGANKRLPKGGKPKFQRRSDRSSKN